MKFFRPRHAPQPAPAAGTLHSCNGMVSYSPDHLHAPTLFENIPVVPVTSEERMVLTGGPVWPEWAQAGELRHQRSGVPVDKQPQYDPGTLQPFDKPALWGGHIVNHFGHFLAEHSTRLLCAARARPDLTILLTLPPDKTPEQVPAFVWQVLKWYGIEATRIHFVTNPLKVRQLWAIPMAEQWAHVPPSGAYLDLLDDTANRNGLTNPPTEIVYVARDGFEQSAEGHNAGESYLTALLPKLGVSVLRPETMKLKAQLACYQKAHTLIFAEGSAMHGRQLLGRINQHVAVLNRRPRSRIALSALQPRCRQLSYVETTRGLASVVWPNGNPWLVRAISLYDPDVLLRSFAALGVPLQDVWDPVAFEHAQEQAIRTWIALRFEPRQPIDHTASRRRVTRELSQFGLDHLAKEIPGTPP